MKNILSILLLCISMNALGQTNEQAKPEINPNVIFEKINIHTDRNLYLSGETIWFKAYYNILNEAYNQRLSNILYVELFDLNLKTRIERKFRIENQMVSGSIEIPKDIKSGNYILRAYTHYLRNHIAENYANSLVTIVNPTSPLPQLLQASNTAQNLRTENGFLFRGIMADITYKIPTLFAEKLESLKVFDEQGYEQLSIDPSSDNTGSFQFTPNDSSLSYKLRITTTEQDTLYQDLPEVQESGIIINSEISNSSQQVEIQYLNVLNQVPVNASIEFKSADLRLFHTEEIILNANQTILKPISTDLNPGLNYIFLKDQNGKLLKAHAFYVAQEEVQIAINLDTQDYGKREKVEFSIQSTTPLENLNVTVVKKGAEPNINNMLWDYSFEYPEIIPYHMLNTHSINQLRPDQLKLALINYNHLLASDKLNRIFEREIQQSFEWIPEIREVSLSGIVRRKSTQAPIQGTQVFASVFGEYPQLHVYETNEAGEFIFSINHLSESQKVFLDINNKDTQDVEILVNNDFARNYPYLSDMPLMISLDDKILLEELFINDQVRSEYEIDNVEEIIYDSQLPSQFSHSDVPIIMNDYIETPTLEQVFNEIVTFVKVKKRDENYYLSIINQKTNLSYDNPLVLVDNIPVFNINELLELAPPLIKEILVNIGTYQLGDFTTNGLISITTNTNNFGDLKFSENAVFLDYNTVSHASTLKVPDYELNQVKSSRFPDFRTVLYWNPMLALNNDQASLSFYTSDHSSEYVIVVRGYTKDGKFCYGEQSFAVE